jgi:hypothetical protein
MMRMFCPFSWPVDSILSFVPTFDSCKRNVRKTVEGHGFSRAENTQLESGALALAHRG